MRRKGNEQLAKPHAAPDAKKKQKKSEIEALGRACTIPNTAMVKISF